MKKLVERRRRKRSQWLQAMVLSAGHQDTEGSVSASVLHGHLLRAPPWCSSAYTANRELGHSLLACATPLSLLPYKGLHKVAIFSFAHELHSLRAFIPSWCRTSAYKVSTRKQKGIMGDLSLTAAPSLTQKTECKCPSSSWMTEQSQLNP